MKTIVAVIIWIGLCSGCLSAAGWGDYTLPIGDDYYIFRANSAEVILSHKKKSHIVYPEGNVGPIVGYRMLDDYVLTKNAGLTLRNKFEGDILENPNRSQSWYFIVPKNTRKAIGPLSFEQFQKELSERSIKEGHWKTPRSPDIRDPLFGLLLIFVSPIFFLGLLLLYYYYISIPLLVLLFWLCYRWWKRRRARKAQL